MLTWRVVKREFQHNKHIRSAFTYCESDYSSTEQVEDVKTRLNICHYFSSIKSLVDNLGDFLLDSLVFVDRFLWLSHC